MQEKLASELSLLWGGLIFLCSISNVFQKKMKGLSPRKHAVLIAQVWHLDLQTVRGLLVGLLKHKIRLFCLCLTVGVGVL